MLSAADQLMSCYHSCVGAATATAVAPEGGTFKPVDQAQHDRGQTPTGIEATDDAVRLTCKGGMVVHLRFCPAFARYEEAVQALGSLGPSAREA